MLYHLSNWPKGHYCIYKKGTCPSGFKEGWVHWDDEDDDNHNAKSGILPDGTYNHDTEIRFCCRRDGISYTYPIHLPKSKPFYLLRIGGYCQTVAGMLVTEEWIRWDSEDSSNHEGRGGVHPDTGNESHNNHLYFCYYH